MVSLLMKVCAPGLRNTILITVGSWSPYVEMSASYQISASWNASLSGRYTRFNSESKDSPMVDKRGQFTVWSGISYRF